MEAFEDSASITDFSLTQEVASDNVTSTCTSSLCQKNN
jgi:hypothetical protein